MPYKLVHYLHTRIKQFRGQELSFIKNDDAVDDVVQLAAAARFGGIQ
jgi:hypothetical protein